MQKITTCLWFNNQAEEAVNFYTSIFKNSKIGTTTRYDKASSEVSGQPEGSVMVITFELDGREFMALNGGPAFTFTEAISLVINCETQQEVDYYWEKLTDGGAESECGWLKDKYGVSWQVTPIRLNELLEDPDSAKAERVMKAMLKMKKLDIPALEAAAEAEA